MGKEESLDFFDLKILKHLTQNGRQSMAQLAEKIGLSKTPCSNRVKRLEQDGFILSYSARLNYEQLNLSHIVFVRVTLSDTRTQALEKFNQAVMLLPEVEQCHMIAADFDYLLKVRTANIHDYRQLMGEKVSALPFVTSTSTYVSMQTIFERNI